jgi:hypothetical protein
MARTFFALLKQADIDHEPKSSAALPKEELAAEVPEKPASVAASAPSQLPGLHYNIQIHLPATKDVEVYNAIFKSLREHLIV